MIIESKVEFSSPKYSNGQKHNKQIKTKLSLAEYFLKVSPLEVTVIAIGT